jgi:hypothetical protein
MVNDSIRSRLQLVLITRFSKNKETQAKEKGMEKHKSKTKGEQNARIFLD